MVAPFYIPISGGWEFRFLHILTDKIIFLFFLNNSFAVCLFDWPVDTPLVARWRADHLGRVCPFLLEENTCSLENTGMPLFYFSVLCFSPVGGWWPSCVGLVCQHHSSNSTCSLCFCHIWETLTVFQMFLFLCYLYGDLWPLIGDVTIVFILGHHKLCPCHMLRLIFHMCVFWKCHWLTVPWLSPSPWASLFLETQQYWNWAS